MEKLGDQEEREPSKGRIKRRPMAAIRKFFSSRSSENLRAAGRNEPSFPVAHPRTQDQGNTLP